MQLTNLFAIDLRVYVAGVLVPATSVSITSSFNAVPSCTISLPPARCLVGMSRQDRVPVHVFFANTLCGEDDSYILLFEGEVVSTGYVSNAIGRELVLNAQSLMSLLRDVNLLIHTDLEEHARASFAGQGVAALQVVGHSGITFPGSLFTHGIAPVGANSLMRRPSDLLANAIDFVAGNIPQDSKTDTEIAKYYANYASRLRLPQRYPLLPYFDDGRGSWSGSGCAFPLLAGVQDETALSQLLNMAGRGPQSASVYALIDYVVRQMEYEFAFYSSPTYDGASNRLHSMCLKPIFYEALPPCCNILFRSENSDLRVNERTYMVPTRIRTRDISGALYKLTKGGESPLEIYGQLDYYPHSFDDATVTAARSNKDPYALDWLESERFTGPYLYETQAPSWFSFISPKSSDDGLQAYKERVLRHMLMLKQYESRSMSVSTVLNPYITPGYPCVVFDSEPTSEFTFAGQVLAVQHTFGKGSVGTSVQLGFVRSLTDELRFGLENSLAVISDTVTRSAGAMSEIYSKVLGCSAVPFSGISGMQGMSYQSDPLEAYKYNKRRIVTFEQYLGFMGLTAAGEGMFDGRPGTPALLRGALVENRRDATLRDKLYEVSEEAFSSRVYA